MTAVAKDFDDYLSQVSEPARTTLQRLRETIEAAIPEATEAISYRLPTFKYRGKPLLALGAAKEHCSLFLMGYVPPELEADLERYETGKGTVRFPVDEPLPTSLVRKVVKVRVAQVDSESERGQGTSG
jgi:uncharacterized protein YdhG (YjbR/CyaY superfamily)